MSSVRERLERSREVPEEVVQTSNRRVALTGGPTLSTRQQADLVASQNEVTVRRPEQTSAASCDFGNGDGFVRVRDRMSIAADAAAAKPQPRPDSPASGWEAMYKRWDDEAKAAEQAKVTARQKREADERVAAEARRQAAEKAQKKAQYEFKENAVLRECSDLSDAEKQIFWSRLLAMNADLDAGAANVVAEEIRASREEEQ